ncbi:MAG TPA: hypothetical protein VE861_03925, partial [Gemmatimonadaceae bacterium]|nr:hypothetical protein [Gemmatimonadaceae bacterium]
MSQLTDVAENAFIDALLRGQTFSPPATPFWALYTAAPGETGGGTEATYTGYARVSYAASLANWAGTQSAGSTTVSSGTGGQTSNNVAIPFGAPTSGPQTVTHFGLLTLVTAGVLWLYGTLTAAR